MWYISSFTSKFLNSNSKITRPTAHVDKPVLSNSTADETKSAEHKTTLVCEGGSDVTTAHRPTGTVLLATTLVKVKSPSRICHVFRRIIDSAS